jgi:hypothetical protein
MTSVTGLSGDRAGRVTPGKRPLRGLFYSSVTGDSRVTHSSGLLADSGEEVNLHRVTTGMDTRDPTGNTATPETPRLNSFAINDLVCYGSTACSPLSSSNGLPVELALLARSSGICRTSTVRTRQKNHLNSGLTRRSCLNSLNARANAAHAVAFCSQNRGRTEVDRLKSPGRGAQRGPRFPPARSQHPPSATAQVPTSGRTRPPRTSTRPPTWPQHPRSSAMTKASKPKRLTRLQRVAIAKNIKLRRLARIAAKAGE